jgi:O-antigen/teichoic acid export membrane protein
MKDSLAKQAGAALVWKGTQFAGTKVIFLVRILVLARLLVPEDFGLLAIASVAIGILLTVSDFGLVPALVQRTDVDENHYNAAWTVAVLRGLTIAGIVVLAAPIIALLFGEPRATNVIRVLALRPLLEAAASIKVAELTRNLRFRSLAFISVPAALVDTIVAISLARSLGVWALVGGALCGAATAAVLSYVMAPHRPRLLLNLSATRPLIQYGRWIFMTGLIAMAGSAVLQGVISRRLGAAELGVYFLASKIAFLPFEVASEVVGSVAFPLYARLKSDGRQARRVFQALLTGMASILVPLNFLLIALAPSLVHYVLGPQWSGTAPIMRILAVVAIVGLLGDTVVPVLKGMGQPYKVTVLVTIHSALTILLAWILVGWYGVVGAALALLLGVGASQILSVVFARQVLGRPFASLGGPLGVIAVASAIGAGVAIGLDSLLAGVSGFAVTVLVAVAATAWTLWVLDRRFTLGIAANLPRVFPQVGVILRISSVDR